MNSGKETDPVSEADQENERNQNIQKSLKQKRLHSLIVGVVVAALSLVTVVVQLEYLAFCFGVVSAISWIRYFDANSHLHEVQQRSTSSLMPDFSLLRRDTVQANATLGGSPSTHQTTPNQSTQK